jgi:hypothetical protein
VLAGFFLSGALAAGCLWAARRRGAGAAGLVAGGCILAVGLLASAAYANLAPIPRPQSVSLPIRSSGGQSIRIYLTRQQLDSLLEVYERRGASGSAGAPGSPAPASAR